MALEGTLKDFSPFDIMELIDIKKKIGLLFVTSSEGEIITLGFESRGLLLAESSAKHLYMQLGTVLVRSGRLTAQQLDKALELQKGTLDPLGYILCREKFCTEEDLCVSLRIQMKRAFFTLLRWTEGHFIFEPRESIEYFHEMVKPVYVKPLNVKGLLMEGAVMIDEWPRVEKVVHSLDIVFRRILTSKRIEATSEDETLIFDFDAPSDTTHNGETIQVTPDEETVYQLIDGHLSVSEILDQTVFSEFVCCKIIYELINKGLLEEVKPDCVLQKKGSVPRTEEDVPKITGPSLAQEGLQTEVTKVPLEVKTKDDWEATRALIQRKFPAASIFKIGRSDKKITDIQGGSGATLSAPILSVLDKISALEYSTHAGTFECVGNQVGTVLFWNECNHEILVLVVRLSGEYAVSRFRSQVSAITRSIQNEEIPMAVSC